MTRIGSLCTGYGGLDMAAEALTGGSVAWVSEIAADACQVITARMPHTPNLGDLTAADWTAAEPVDVLTAGYPCQPFSTAGRRQGADDPRHIWPHVLRAIRDLRPRLVLLENVAGHLSLGFGRVLGDLAAAGFDAEWAVLRASDVGACHRRARLFIAAHPKGVSRSDVSRFVDAKRSLVRAGTGASGRDVAGHSPEGVPVVAGSPWLARSAVADADGQPAGRDGQTDAGTEGQDEGWPEGHRDGSAHGARATADADGAGSETRCGRSGTRDAGRLQPVERCGTDWNGSFGPYAAAVDRWAAILGRPAPAPLDDGKLNARFVEWMMGLPDGWVCDVLPRRKALHVLGNGVVPQQALAAFRSLSLS